MNVKLTAETRQRLQHALARLQSEPRAGERRRADRRRAQVSPMPPDRERRRNDDRRQVDRRGSGPPELG